MLLVLDSYRLHYHSSAAVESTGQSRAEAQSRAESMKIEGEAAVDQAKLAAEAENINAVSLILNICSGSKIAMTIKP